MTITEQARQFLFVRELTGENDGLWVEMILFFVNLKKGNPWCAAFVSLILGIHFQGKSPLPRTASCEEIHKYAKAHGLVVEEPQEGDVFLILRADGWAHHTGFVRGPAVRGVVPTIEGNTNPAGGRDGYGVFERNRQMGKSLVFVRPKAP